MTNSASGFEKQKHVWLSYFIFLLSSMLVSFTILSLLSLQSSLNVEAGLGVASLAVWAAFQVLAVFFAKGICTTICPKTALIFSDAIAIPYIAANFYPNFYTLIPSAALFGIGRGIYWVVSPVFIVGYANLFTKFGHKYQKSLAFTNSFFISSFFSGQILGNLVPYLVIKTSVQTNNQTGFDDNSSTTPTQNAFVNSSIQSHKFALKDVCGANDCQDPSVITSGATNIVPPTQETLYLLLGVLAAAYFTGMLGRALFAPDFKGAAFKAEEIPKFSKTSIGFLKKDKNKICKEIDKKFCECNVLESNLEKAETIICTVQNNNNLSSKKGDETNTTLERRRTTKLAIFFAEIKFSAKFLLNRHQLLLATLNLHTGSSLGFTAGEITRAYVSCVFGVKQVGLTMALYGISSVLSSILTGKLSAKFGRKICVISACLVHTAAYCFCLLWKPDENANLGTVFGMLIAFGFADSAFMSMSTETILVHFPNLVNGVFVSWVFWYCCGMCLQFAWSTALCVKTKIYIMFFILYFGLFTYGIAENRHSKKKTYANKKSCVT